MLICICQNALDIKGGLPPYQYLWSTGEQTAEITIAQDGVYTLTVTDEKNCSAVKIYYLKVSGHKSPSADRIQLFQHSETITILSQGTLIDKIQLLSLNGKMIHSQSIVSEKFTFQKENLIQSMSILRVYLIDGSIRSFKVF